MNSKINTEANFVDSKKRKDQKRKPNKLEGYDNDSLNGSIEELADKYNSSTTSDKTEVLEEKLFTKDQSSQVDDQL